MDHSATIQGSSHELHCPRCGMTLHKLRRGYVDVQTCLNCKGIWLDEKRLEILLADQKFSGQLVNAVLNIFKRKSFWGA